MDNNNQKLLERLYLSAFPPVARIVAQLGGDLDSAKDIFHDALIIYMEKQRQHLLTIKVTPEAYLTGIARILWIRKFKNDSRNVSLSGSEEEFSVPEDFYLTEKAISHDLLAYMESTGKKCLELLQAFYYEQRSMQEIADKFNYKTRHSATVQKHKCLERIREQIKAANIYEKSVA